MGKYFPEYKNTEKDQLKHKEALTELFGRLGYSLSHLNPVKNQKLYNKGAFKEKGQASCDFEEKNNGLKK